jgi:hypothetical protein
MEPKLSMNSRSLAATLIKVVAFILAFPYLLDIGSVIYFGIAAIFKPSGQPDLYQDFLLRFGSLVLNVGIYGLFFLGAGRLSRLLFEEDDAVALEGDPYTWAIPALQIVGLVYFLGGIIGLFPVIQSFREHLEASDALIADKVYWKDIWSVFVRLLAGFLLFRNPRWLATKMRRFGKLEW